MAIHALVPAQEQIQSEVEPLPEGLVEAGVYPTATEGAERGLVILAAGAPYWLTPSAAGHHLFVEPEAVQRARTHLAKYERERIGWPPAPIVDPWIMRRADTLPPLLWALSVLAIFRFKANWTAKGALDAAAVFVQGEWWRPVTALFLHADAAHVISNALGGILVFTAVLSTFGRWRGVVGLALAGILGNLAVAAAHYPGPYRSVGASTAIFAGLGLLTGRAIRVIARTRHPHRWRAMFVPFAAGLTVFALHGAGAQRVDIGAHLAGFLVGLLMGFIAGPGRSPATGIELRSP